MVLHDAAGVHSPQEPLGAPCLRLLSPDVQDHLESTLYTAVVLPVLQAQNKIKPHQSPTLQTNIFFQTVASKDWIV